MTINKMICNYIRIEREETSAQPIALSEVIFVFRVSQDRVKAAIKLDPTLADQVTIKNGWIVSRMTRITRKEVA
jgi:hypothetical protein